MTRRAKGRTGVRAVGVAVAILGVLGSAASALAIDLEVPSARHPTIRSALAKARPGDRVVIAPGTYDERPRMVRASGVTIEGEGATWRWTGRLPARLRLLGDDVVVHGLTLDGIEVLVRGDGATLEDVTSKGPVRQSWIRVQGDDSTVLRSTIDTAGGRSKISRRRGRRGLGALQVDGDGALVDRCTLLTPASGGFDLVTVDGESGVVVGCTVAGNAHSIRVTGERGAVTGNTVFVRDGIGIAGFGGPNLLVADNTLFVRQGRAISVSSFGALFRDNRIELDSAHPNIPGDPAEVEPQRKPQGIVVHGARATVLGNRITGGDGYPISHTAIFIGGRDATVSANDLLLRSTGIGIWVRNTGAVLDGNAVIAEEDTPGFSTGIEIESSGAVVRRCVTRGGTHGVRLDGSGNVCDRVETSDCSGSAIWVPNDDNRLIDCRTSNSLRGLVVGGDRLRVEGLISTGDDIGISASRAVDTWITGCTVTGARTDALRLDRCTNTTVLESTFLGSGSRDVVGDGTYGELRDNTFETGGF